DRGALASVVRCSMPGPRTKPGGFPIKPARHRAAFAASMSKSTRAAAANRRTKKAPLRQHFGARRPQPRQLSRLVALLIPHPRFLAVGALAGHAPIEAREIRRVLKAQFRRDFRAARIGE